MNCKMKKAAAVCLAAVLSMGISSAVLAAGGSSGPAVKYAKQGQIGEVITNPYRIAPLTAIIRSGASSSTTSRSALSRRKTAPKSPTRWIAPK